MKLSAHSNREKPLQNTLMARLEEADKIQYKNPQNAYRIASEIYQSVDETQESEVFLRALYLKGRNAWHLGHYEEALISGNTLLDKSRALNHLSFQAEAFNLIGTVNLYLDNLDQALEYYRDALKLSKKSYNVRVESAAYNNIGEIYNKLNAHDQATEYYTKALRLSESTNDSNGVGIAYLNLGELAMKDNRLELAIHRVLSALEVFKTDMDRLGEAHAHCLIADILKMQSDTQKAEHHYLEAERLVLETGDQYTYLLTGLAYAELLIDQSRFDEAEKRCDNILDIAKQMGAKSSQAHALSLLAKISEKKDDYKTALLFYKRYHAMDHKIQQDTLDERLNHIRSQFRIEQTQHEKEIFKLKNVELQSKNKELQKLHDNIEVISKIGRDITSTLDLNLIFKRIYENVNTLMDASFFGISLYDEKSKTIKYPMFINDERQFEHENTSIDDMNSLSAWCIRNRKEIFTNDYLAEYICYKEDPMSNRKGRMSQSILYVPLFIENKIIGTITAQSYNRNAYTKHHLDMLKTLASYTAIAIRNGQESDMLEAEIRRRKTVQDELINLNKQLIEMTYIDALTQIPNRRHFTDTLEKEISRSIRDNHPLGLLLIDIDKFKEYNDNYGHTAGDTCLHAIAQILKTSLKRKTDFVARYGGDEFIAILPGTDLDGAVQVAEDMRKNVQLAQIEHKYSTVSPIISITLGIYSEFPDTNTSLERIVQLADQALYTAKDMGRNCVAANISPIQFENKG